MPTANELAGPGVEKNHRDGSGYVCPYRDLPIDLSSSSTYSPVSLASAGRTGSIVFSLLDTDPRFDVVGLVRSEESAKKLIAKTDCLLEEVVVSDVTQMQFDNVHGRDSHPWPHALDNAEAMVICTSAVPQVSKKSIIKAILKIPINVLTRKKKAINFRDLQFKYKPGQYPEMVDYVGLKKQIDFAKTLGVKHVVCML